MDCSIWNTETFTGADKPLLSYGNLLTNTRGGPAEALSNIHEEDGELTTRVMLEI